MKYHTLIIEKANVKETVYTYLKSQGYSENFISNLRQNENNIMLNNVLCNTRAKVKAGDMLEVNVSPNKKTQIDACNIVLDIVYEDDYILVVNKPELLSSMPNRSHYTNNLAGAVVFYMQQKDPNFVLRMVNRLDKDTQGLILIAKNTVVYKPLLQSVKKKYHAIVCGKIEHDLVIDKNILDEVNDIGIVNLKRVVNETGKIAKTYVKPLKRFKEHTLCEMQLEHGRTHQIRVHLSHIGHPLLGDYIYGKEQKEFAHTALVCKSMQFVHPVTYESVYLEVDYSKSFKNYLLKL